MKKAIYISIKPQYTKLIEKGTKNYEFRKYIPKKTINTLFVYESSPTCALKYIIEIGNIVKYPTQILETGIGNDDFNKGSKDSKYAYQIKHVYILKEPIKLHELKEKYDFCAPQSYAYDDKYGNLTNYLLSAKVRKII